VDGPKFAVFLCHSKDDEQEVEKLAHLLDAQKIKPWFDGWDLIPGQPWQEQIERALEDSASCAVCLGSKKLARWQNEEMRAALDLLVDRDHDQFSVIPVLLPGADLRAHDGLPLFLKRNHPVEFRDSIEDERALRGLIRGIRRMRGGPDPSKAKAQDDRPYRGLNVFDMKDARYFFGREGEIDDLLEKLSRSRFLAVIGPSGSGKSSLVRAGLLGALKSGEIPGSDSWKVVILEPGEQPLQSLGVYLSSSPNDPVKTHEFIQKFSSNAEMLHITTRLALLADPADRRYVIFVDQFEEVFTLCSDDAARRAFIDNLLYAAKAKDGKTVVLLTLRADFYDRCAAYRELADALSSSQILVGPMTPEEVWRTIERPARLAGLELEPGLVDLLLKDVEGQPGCLPLLEHALEQIWLRREKEREWLTVAAYREIEGVSGALRKRAEAIFNGFTKTEREACRRVFLRLVQVDESQSATKRRLGLEELFSQADPDDDRRAAQSVVDRLTDERLLITGAAREDKHPTVEVVHEVLFTAWSHLRDWIEKDRENLLTRRELLKSAQEWLAKERDPSYLHGGTRLVKAKKWAGSHPGELSPEAREFLAESVARQRWKLIFRGMSVFAAVIVATAMVRLWQTSRRQPRINVATQIAEQARHNVETNPLISLLLAAEAVRMAGELPDAQGALLAALARSDAQPLGRSGIAAMAPSLDRRSVVTVGQDGTATLWDLGAVVPKVLGTIHVEEEVAKVALSNNRRWLLLEDREGNVHLYNFEGKAHSPHLPIVSEAFWPPGEPFSPDGRWLITRSWDTPVLHALDPDASEQKLPQVRRLLAMAYSPDSRLSVALEGGQVEIWNIPPTNRRPLPGLPADIGNLAFSSNGQWLAAAVSKDGGANAWIWHLDSAGDRSEPLQLDGCTANRRVAISPDGSRIFTWGNSSNACLWKLEGGLRSIPEKLASASEADFSPDGRWLAWGEENGAARLLSSGRAPLELPGQGKSVHSLFFAGDRRLITQAGSEAPRVWDLHRYVPDRTLAATRDGVRLAMGAGGNVYVLAPGKAVRTLQGAADWTANWAISPDGTRVAASEGKDRILLWNLAEGNPIPRIATLPESAGIISLAFSPKGDRLAIGGVGYAELWDFAQSREPQRLSRDPQRRGAYALAFDSSASRLATGWTDGKIRIFHLNDPELPLLNAPPGRDTRGVTALAFSPDGERLAIADANGDARLWRQEREEPLESQDASARILAFGGKDGRRLASGGLNGVLQVWDLAAGGIPVSWHGHQGAVVALSFGTDGREVISTGANDTVRRWPLEPAAMIRLACEWAGRNLTKEEWRTHAPEGVPFREDTPCGHFERQ